MVETREQWGDEKIKKGERNVEESVTISWKINNKKRS